MLHSYNVFVQVAAHSRLSRELVTCSAVELLPLSQGEGDGDQASLIIVSICTGLDAYRNLIQAAEVVRIGTALGRSQASDSCACTMARASYSDRRKATTLGLGEWFSYMKWVT